MTEAVKFDVGGQLYKVSRSLLDKHPDSMLARSASEQWQEDPEAEIFIERNGLRFQYILDYMRDDKLTLPLTESREMIIAELEYYGIAVGENTIIDTAVNNLNYAKSMSEMMTTLKENVSSSGEKHYAAKVAIDCITLWCTKSPYLSSSDGKVQATLNHQDKAITDNFLGLYKNQPDQSKREASVSFYLNQVGLQFFISNGAFNYTVKQLDA